MKVNKKSNKKNKLDQSLTTYMVLRYNKKINKKQDRNQQVPDHLIKAFNDWLGLAKARLDRLNGNEPVQTEPAHPEINWGGLNYSQVPVTVSTALLEEGTLSKLSIEENPVEE